MQKALDLLRPMFREGYEYAKARIMLSELTDASGLQDDLFEASAINPSDSARSVRLMAVIDEINRKSQAKIYLAREAGLGAYKMRRSYLSPKYTTAWTDLLVVR